MWVCQRTIKDSNGAVYETGCGYNSTAASFAPFSYLKPLAGNFSANNHTVYGSASY